MEVLVFKTSVSKRTHINKVRTLLKRIDAIDEWNFDLEDCDNILRIVADDISPRRIESVLQTAGFECQELQ
jgi:hypothetical protein